VWGGISLATIWAITSGGIDRDLIPSGERLPLGAGNEVLDLWFADDGQLVLVENDRSVIRVYKGLRPTARDKPLVVLDISRELKLNPVYPKNSRGLVQSESLKLALTGLEAQKNLSKIQLPPLPVVPFAVSEDGLSVAWTWGDKIWIRSVSSLGEPPKNFEVTRQDGAGPIGALAFVGQDVVVALPMSGKLVGYRYTDGQLSSFALPIDRSWILWTRGPNLVAASKWSGPSNGPGQESNITETPPADEESIGKHTEVIRVRLDGLAPINVQLSGDTPGIGTAFAYSPSGDVLIGTSQGKIRRLSSNGDAGIGYYESGAIKAIAVEGNNIALAGDFPGIVLSSISNLSKAEKFLDAPVGINTISLSKDRLAYAAEDSAELVDLRSRCELNSRGYLILTVFSILLSVVALVHALMIDKHVPRDSFFRFKNSFLQNKVRPDKSGMKEDSRLSALAPDQQGEIARQQPRID
jgi:hypothetical protein